MPHCTLQLPPQRVFPVSVQKGLVAKITRDPMLLARSRLPELERALSREIVPQQQSIVREQVRREFDEAYAVTHGVIAARKRNLVEQVFELNGLRGKNRAAIEQMARRIRVERGEFDLSLRKLQALRMVFGRHQQSIYKTVGVDNLKRHVRAARQQMLASKLSVGLRHFGAMSLLTTEKWALTRRFFESVVARIRDVYDRATRELESWLRAVIAPLESQVREHQQQLRRRLDSVQRIMEASDQLEVRIAELEDGRAQVDQQLEALQSLGRDVGLVLERRAAPTDEPLAA
jgi:hypothetical protein